MNEERLNEILATAKHAAYAHPGCYGLDRAAIELVAEVQRLQKAIWPGLPKWKPTPEQPQQDFYEAVIEDLREGSSKWDSANSALDNIPERFTKWIDTWMAVNQLRANQIRYGCFPLGMVQNWVERAEKAEKELEEAKIEIHNLKAELDHSHEYVEELREHERQTYDIIGDFLGRDVPLKAGAKRLFELCERVVVASHMRHHAGLSKPDFPECKEGFCGEWRAIEAGREAGTTSC